KRCKTCRTTRRRGRVSGFTTKINSNAPPAFPTEEQRSGTFTKPAARSARHSFEIRCAECGVTAFVPFKPVEGRAVYCPACYEARKGSVRQATDGVEIDADDEGIIE